MGYEDYIAQKGNLSANTCVDERKAFVSLDLLAVVLCLAGIPSRSLSVTSASNFDMGNSLTIHGVLQKFLAKSSSEARSKAAIKFSSRTITFAQLDRFSQYVMALLQTKIRQYRTASVKIALMMEPCLELIPILFGIVKLGVPYIPLGPKWTAEELDCVIRQNQPQICICDSSERFAVHSTSMEIFDSHMFLLVAADHFSSCKNFSNPSCTEHTTAVVLHKRDENQTLLPVALSHGIILNRISAHWEKLPFSKDEVVLMRGSLTSTDSLVEIFGSLLVGHTVLVLPRKLLVDTKIFLDVVEKEPIGRVFFTTAELFDLCKFLRSKEKRFHGLLKLVMVTGDDVLPVQLAKEFFDVFPKCKLGCAYSKMEFAGAITWSLFDDKSDLLKNACEDVIPCGSANKDFGFFIVDAFMRSVGHGSVGDLYVESRFHNEFSASAKLVSGSEVLALIDTKHLLRTGDLAFIHGKNDLLYVLRPRELCDGQKLIPESSPEETVQEVASNNSSFSWADFTAETEGDIMNILTASTVLIVPEKNDLLVGGDTIEKVQTYVQKVLFGLEPREVVFILKDSLDQPCALTMAYDPCMISEETRSLLIPRNDPKNEIADFLVELFSQAIPQLPGKFCLLSAKSSVV